MFEHVNQTPVEMNVPQNMSWEAINIGIGVKYYFGFIRSIELINHDHWFYGCGF